MVSTRSLVESLPRSKRRSLGQSWIKKTSISPRRDASWRNCTLLGHSRETVIQSVSWVALRKVVVQWLKNYSLRCSVLIGLNDGHGTTSRPEPPKLAISLPLLILADHNTRGVAVVTRLCHWLLSVTLLVSKGSTESIVGCARRRSLDD